MPTEWHKNPSPEDSAALVVAVQQRPSEPKRVPRLAELTTWDAFTRHVPLHARLSPRQTLMLHQAASFPLTLAAALVAFELDSRSAVCVHVVNIGHEDRRIFETGSVVMGRSLFLRMQLLFCGVCAAQNGMSGIYLQLMSGRNAVDARTQWGVWHERARDLPPPDLVIGFNTDLHAVAYEWPATLRALVARKVPAVFTSANDAEYERALEALRGAKASLAFHGRGPFPSPQPECRLGELQHLNAFWVAFSGGLA